MEWNSARMKFPLLSGTTEAPADNPPFAAPPSLAQALSEKSYADLCKLGLALTWPIALAALAIFVVLLTR
jgi:hypothetical protein